MAHIANSSEVRSVWGSVGDVVSKLMEAAETAGARDGWDCLHLLTTPLGQPVLAEIGGILADARCSSDIERVAVEKLSLSESIAKCGFDEVDPRIEPMFSALVSQEAYAGIVNIATLWAYGELSTYASAMARLTKQNRRPITLSELLAKIRNPGGVNCGATFALGTIAETAEGKFVCYVDKDVSASGKGVIRQCLKIADVDHLFEVVDEAKNWPIGRGWILAVREDPSYFAGPACGS